ncbi:MAG: DUF533 domain-containing protein [Planctomycetes bacterium]|nr:DUF533 domain-containing protein [Planctomycetota bacterium]
MDPTRLLSSLLGGVLDTRPKKHDRLSRFLSGSSGSLWNARTLLAAGALGWAAYEVFRTRGGGPGGATIGSSGATVVPGTVVIPSSPPAHAAAVTPPPLPPDHRGSGPAIEPVRRLVGVLLAAARADGELGEAEYGRLLSAARDAGGESLVGEELRAPTPLATLAGGIPEPRAREDLYRLAYGIVRCDEGVSAPERAWLGRLASALGLDAQAAARLEHEVAAGIARA